MLGNVSEHLYNKSWTESVRPPLVSPEPLDLWSGNFACLIYSSNERFLWKKILENQKKKKKFQKNFQKLFFQIKFHKKIFGLRFFSYFFFRKYSWFFSLFRAGGGGERSERRGGCRRAKRAARRRPRCRSRRLRQQRVHLKICCDLHFLCISCNFFRIWIDWNFQHFGFTFVHLQYHQCGGFKRQQQ